MNYVEIKKKYLADALSFLGFRYFKFTNNGEILYSFENTNKFQLALADILYLKEKYKNY